MEFAYLARTGVYDRLQLRPVTQSTQQGLSARQDQVHICIPTFPRFVSMQNQLTPRGCQLTILSASMLRATVTFARPRQADQSHLTPLLRLFP